MERITRSRAFALLLIFAAILGIYSVRMYSMQVLGTGDVVRNSDTQTFYYTVKAARGDILDRNGNVLVSNQATYNLVFNNFVLSNSGDVNGNLLKLVQLCDKLDIDYIEHFPISDTRPYEYTLDQQSAAWQNYFKEYLSYMEIDSDISAPRLMEKLKKYCKIPKEWSDEDARRVLGLRYELALRTEITNLPSYIFIENVDDQSLNAISELNIPGLEPEASTIRVYNTKYAASELNIPGLEPEASTIRVYNTKYAAHILGTMGKIDAENWPEYEAKGYPMDAYVGTSGFELAFEEELRGIDGQIARTVDKDGNVISEYYTKKPVAGNNVETTIDLNLQRIAEEGIAAEFQSMRDNNGLYGNGMEYYTKKPVAGNNVETTIDLNLQRIAEEGIAAEFQSMRDNNGLYGNGMGADVEGGAVVVLDPNTGAVLACASYPTYDPDKYFSDYEQITQIEYQALYNRPLLATYPPGSIFKMSMATAALETGTIDRYTQIEDLGVFDKYDGISPMCLIYARRGVTHGYLTVDQALRDSCNYFFYELGDRMSIETTDQYAKAFGLGEPTGVELPEAVGHRANPETKAALYEGSGAKWYMGDQILAAIGQSEHAFTPMQMASYTATIANGGTRYACTFLERVVSADYATLVRENSPRVLSTVPMSKDTHEAIVQGMREVITEGTASSYFWDYNTVEVCGKTGTAEHGSGGSNNGSFVCFAPMNDPKIAIAVYGEKAGEGGNLSNVAKPIMDAYFSADEARDMVTYENRLG